MISSARISSPEIYERNPDIQWRSIEGRIVLVDSAESELIYFNDLGTLIWQRLDGRNSLPEILAQLHSGFDVSFKALEKDAMKFIRQLSQMELIRKKHKAS